MTPTTLSREELIAWVKEERRTQGLGSSIYRIDHFDALLSLLQSPSVRSAAEALVAKVRAIEQDPRYRTVWESFAMHGGRYSEPTYTAELKALEAALEAKAPAETRPTCGTCKHWAKNHADPAWRHSDICFARGMYRGRKPADGSGFCHNHAPVDTLKESQS